jgi:hypothetical protein
MIARGTLSLILVFAAGAVRAEEKDRAYSRQIRPLLQKYCFACHAGRWRDLVQNQAPSFTSRKRKRRNGRRLRFRLVKSVVGSCTSQFVGDRRDEDAKRGSSAHGFSVLSWSSWVRISS